MAFYVFVVVIVLAAKPFASGTFEALSASLAHTEPAPLLGRFDPAGPPAVVSLAGRDDVFGFLRSMAFADTYWERFPVLIRTRHAFASVLDLDRDVLSGSFVVRGNKRVAPFRNVRFVPSAFHKEGEAARSLGFQDGAVVGEQELRRAMAAKHTLQMYGAQAWWPGVAELCMNLSLATALPTNVNVYITPGIHRVFVSGKR